jgi:flagellar biosynthesis chaperone FliJ
MKEVKMSMLRRRTKLASLIEDCQKIGVSKKVVGEFKKQLKTLDKEIADEKKKRIKWEDN